MCYCFGAEESRAADLRRIGCEQLDLAVLRAAPETDGGGSDGAGARLDLARRRRAELRMAMCPLGSRLYAERPQALTRRYGAYRRVWHGEA